jgi:hypothetical protein
MTIALFSHRKGFKPAQKALQTESVDTELRNDLWNVLTIFYWKQWVHYQYAKPPGTKMIDDLFSSMWMHYFKQPLDEKPPFKTGYGATGYGYIRQYFFSCEWNEIYDFVEYVAKTVESDYMDKFVESCNFVLERNNSGYRFVGQEIAQITDETEIETIDDAIKKSPDAVRTHLKTALQYLADRKSPDYRNSVKESISAVESLCMRIVEDPKATLGDALKRINQRVPIHGALEQGFSKLYGYTSDEKGVRHALLDEDKVSFSDAKFMLSACSAFVNYLIGKCAETGIKI